MKSLDEINALYDALNSELSVEAQVNVLYEVTKNILDEGAIRARSIRFKLKKMVESNNYCERLYALSNIILEGNGLKEVPTEENVEECLKNVCSSLSDVIAKRYVQTEIEKKVEQFLIEKQDKYVDEIRLNIMKKQKGNENAKTLKKLEEL